ncbi:MAG: hypothetical protein MK193_11870 [Lentisphaeria bacterium]|nr:hypothetical protein [Lentisphaeria bacterium]
MKRFITCCLFFILVNSFVYSEEKKESTQDSINKAYKDANKSIGKTVDEVQDSVNSAYKGDKKKKEQETSKEDKKKK